MNLCRAALCPVSFLQVLTALGVIRAVCSQQKPVTAWAATMPLLVRLTNVVKLLFY